MIITGAGALVKYCIIIKAVFVLSADVTVYNNVVFDTVIEAKQNCTVKNTVGRNTLLPAIDITIDAAKTVTGQYNLFQDAAKSGAGTYTDTGTIWNSNPLFISSTDFHLQPSSPCINAGVNVGLTTDYVGDPVPIRTTPDIGAYEFQYVLCKVATDMHGMSQLDSMRG
jgi:hypothetical protein